MELLVVAVASLFAGFVDSIVGGGGLILIPALFATFPQTPPATLFGTNKGASVWGTSMAAWRFARRVQMPWAVLLPASAMSFGMSFAGAWLVTMVSPSLLRQALPAVLCLLLAYTLYKKDLGHAHAPLRDFSRERKLACLIGGGIGLYDGFFGPGTGSFFVFLLVRVLGYDFLHASAGAKLLNMASNLSAILLFALKGHIWWHYVLVMAIANVLGSVGGSYLALKHGSGFVRRIFITVVIALICKSTWDILPSTWRTDVLHTFSALAP
ncbi:TSUP family transporter [Curvibacter sp. CHRR-16]|uniref:sulfite exporter TauE/SafE family protein n=1 Tax=Curvibacter sp. CHRR-16 TaxID=2835872 RepID=UPI001BD99A00|nr:TSUP family transporter [Curvibacter sp. CHRR-16]MBT0570056.1 TSUP family transporter [Curvibacter sp. CHRR-16]